MNSVVTKLPAVLLTALTLALVGCAHFEDKPLVPARTAEALESRSLAETGLRDFVSTNLGRNFPAWPPSEWDLDQLTLAAIYFHPNLDVARAQWAVAQAGVKTAGGRPNPSVSVTPEYNVNAASGVSPWAPAISFDVPLETAGKRRHRLTRAAHLAEAARLQVFNQVWQTRAQLRTALTDYSALTSRLASLRSRVELQEQIVVLLEQRRAAGAISANEVATARIALSKWRTELTAAQSRLDQARAAIAAAVGLSVKSLAGFEFRVDLDAETPAARITDVTELRRVALQQRADIRVSLAEYASSQAALQLEIAKQWPDVHLNPGYQWDQGESKWSLGLSIELPVLNQNQGPIAEAAARRVEAAARFTAFQAKVIAELDRAEAGWRSAQEQLRQTGEILTAQRQQVSRLEAAQAAGGADRLDIAATRLEVVAVELLRQEALVQLAQAVNDLEAGLQRPIDFLETTALRHDAATNTQPQ